MASRRAFVFDTPQDVPELIRSLSGQQPALVDLHVLPGQVLLSVGDAQWVAQMEAARAAYRRQHFSGPGLARRPLLCRPRLPADASLKLDFEIHEDGRRVREQIWRSALSPRRAWPWRRRRGWRAARSSGRRGAALGTDDAALQWTATPVEQGSGIWIRAGHDENPVDAGVAPFWRLRAAALAAALATARAVREHAPCPRVGRRRSAASPRAIGTGAAATIQWTATDGGGSGIWIRSWTR